MGRATAVRQRGFYILGVVPLKLGNYPKTNYLKIFRIFVAEVVYMVLGSFYLFASKILALGKSTTFGL